ncbi:MAG: hypothetical protein IJ867_07290 [Clostridia bacterium]|nr:hypothetical protein [Clostridia bacterium]
MDETLLLVIMLVEVIIIFMLEKKNYMAIIASLVVLGVYYMGEMFYYKLYMKGSLGYQNFSPIAIIYAVIVIGVIVRNIFKAKKNEDSKSLKTGIRVLLITSAIYLAGKGIVISSEYGIEKITDSMMETDFTICQVFRIIINSIVISYLISSFLKPRENANNN